MLLGAPVWGKPLKFAVSFIVYGLTLAWMLTLPHRASRWTWWMTTLLAVTGMVDVGVVVAQAARGTFSHFNQADDPFTDGISLIFGVGVHLLMLANFVLAGLLIFQRVGDRVLPWAIRAGLAFVVAGIGLGFWIPARSSEVWTAVDAAGHAIRVGLMIVTAAAYAGLIVLVTWQAVRGQALIHPDGQTLGALALLIAATTAAGWAVVVAGGSPGRTG
ncbi:hypothetical protein AB0J43_12355 [Nonomuraea fuscirosea]